MARLKRRQDEFDRDAGPPGRTRYLTVHRDDPTREQQIADAKRALGPRDDLVVIELSGGYRGALFADGGG